ncbi:uncharacterized protein EV420DRAFT_1735640 [Desarmillaria tabescens]|uniref:Uncharacterized protein n=1 Tax=Armillaria tabescens TaxID=1929756 RepID=A0AA39JBR8_ARMTA|nr:uncharacterized protein EV420DRAFT_1735640 [Desarmillaria tabescens]KAK0439080.1 hypothetical protein EV420DRAFT_1735640 [Desarmillaria tabescens]
MPQYVCPSCTKKILNTPHAIGAHKTRCSGHKSRTRELVQRLQSAGIKIAKKVSLSALKKQKTPSLLSDEAHSILPSVSQVSEPILNDHSDGDIVMEAPDDINTVSPSREELAPEAEPAPELGRFRRTRMIPRRLYDYLPSKAHKSPSPSPVPSPSPQPPSYIDTQPDEFGMFKRYKNSLPSTSPDEVVTLDTVVDAPTFAVAPDPMTQPDPTCIYGSNTGRTDFPNASTSNTPWFSPFLNASVCRLMRWFYSSTTKTLGDLNRLVNEVILMPDFKKSDLHGFEASREAERLDHPEEDPASPFRHDGWTEDHVSIPLPPPNPTLVPEDPCPCVDIPNVWHRSLLDIIRSAFEDPQFNDFHIKGFTQMWNPPGSSHSERIFGEVYSSDVFLEMEESVQPFPGCNLEQVIAPVMVYSDSTHLTNFGDASLWPAYASLGLLSKYVRARMTAFASHHLAYFPSLPDWIKDEYVKAYGVPPSDATLTFLKRELMQGIWRLLLDEQFMDAYRNGIVIRCADGVERRVYPRFFTYSADYPEKVLLCSIKHLGKCLCPRCLIVKDKVRELGTKLDMRRRETQARVDSVNRQNDVTMAQDWIYNRGYPVDGKAINDLLGTHSLTPNRNAFSEVLLAENVNFYELFVPDQMHEVEIGGWKSYFNHLVRICHSYGSDIVQKVNKRFRSLPTFGLSTIRKFRTDTTAQKKFAARDYEDALQCALPCFEGLLPKKENNIVLDNLFDLAAWHGFAKLRLHTESTLQVYDALTTSLGYQLRTFETKVCPQFQTKETPTEAAARLRRQAQQAKKSTTSAKSESKKASTSKGHRRFNLNTYKFHSFGDYPRAIRRYGTTDSYSTQTGEQEHHRVKLFYARTNKRGHVRQIAVLEQRQRWLQRIYARRAEELKRSGTKQTASLRPDEKEPLPPGNPAGHYQMSNSKRYPLDLNLWLADNEKDLAVADFIPKLKDHILHRLFEHEDNPTVTMNHHNSLFLVNNRIYRHKILQINYTTYDVRRDQDSINPRTRSDVMVLANDTKHSHPYWYARVIGVFHTYAQYNDLDSDDIVPAPFHVDFLWVRWYGLDSDRMSVGGFKAKRPHCIGFMDSDDPDAFGFLNPDDVIRAVHLKPVFARGHTSDFLPPSIARRPDEQDKDWERFYVNMFVDRDMLMRFCGLGVGHKNTWHETQVLRKEICEAFNISDHYEDMEDARISDEDTKESDISSGSSMALGSDQGSINGESEKAGSDDEEEWDDVEWDEENDSDSDEGREECWCDEDDNPVDSEGFENMDDVEMLGYS